MLQRATLVLGLVSSLVVAAPVTAATAPALDVEVRLAPEADHEGGYRCTAVVRDAGAGTVLSAPTIIFLRGQEAQTTSEIEGGGVVRLDILVSEDGSEVSYRAELVMNGEVVASQRATIRL